MAIRVTTKRGSQRPDPNLNLARRAQRMLGCSPVGAPDVPDVSAPLVPYYALMFGSCR
jgi:hypothetical protein